MGTVYLAEQREPIRRYASPGIGGRTCEVAVPQPAIRRSRERNDAPDSRPDAKLTAEVASEICERTGSGAVVEGSIAPLGSQYLLALHARNCRTGDALDDEETATSSKDDVFKVLREMANRVVVKAGQLVPPLKKQPPYRLRTPRLVGSLEVVQRWNKSCSAEGITDGSYLVTPVKPRGLLVRDHEIHCH
jgi:hypothetical protein